MTCSAAWAAGSQAAQVDVGRRSELLRRDAVDLAGSAAPSRPRSATARDPFGRRRQRNHSGLDISGDRGDPVFATADGVVEFAGSNGDYGNMVAINHGLRARHPLRAPVDACSVRPGDRVERGQIIGQIGTTGRVTGPHLHYELLVNGQLANPLPLIDGQPVSR